MIMIKGFLEILQMADGNTPKSFNDFTKISVGRRKLSSATVAKRLDELVRVKVIEELVSRSKTGRRMIAYKTTAKGKRVMEMTSELQQALALPRGEIAL